MLKPVDHFVIKKNKESRVMNPAEAREKRCATAKKLGKLQKEMLGWIDCSRRAVQLR
jgi:hypothetical protein